MLAFHHQVAGLVVHGRAHDDHPGGAPRLERGDGERRVHRVARVDRLEEAGRLLEEGDQRLADAVRARILQECARTAATAAEGEGER